MQVLPEYSEVCSREINEAQTYGAIANISLLAEFTPPSIQYTLCKHAWSEGKQRLKISLKFDSLEGGV